MNPQTVRERSQAAVRLHRQARSSRGDIAIFSRQIATMMAAGVPMVQAFDIIADGQKNVRFKNILLDIKTEHRRRLGAARGAGASYPVQFDELYCNLVHAGETGRCARYRARHGRDLQGKHRSDQEEDQEGAVLPDDGAGGGVHGLPDHADVRGAAVRKTVPGASARELPALDPDARQRVGVHAELLVDGDRHRRRQHRRRS